MKTPKIMTARDSKNAWNLSLTVIPSTPILLSFSNTDFRQAKGSKMKANMNQATMIVAA